MKAKKLVALIMSAAMVVGAASMFAACKKDDDDKGQGGTNQGENQGGNNQGGNNQGGNNQGGNNQGGNNQGGNNEGGNGEGGNGEGSTFVNDENSYYVVGDGHGDLKANGWNANSDSIPFTKDTTVTNENVYTIELKMYAGDAFKILCDTTKGWGGEQVNQYSLGENEYFKTGIENIELLEGYDGIYTFTLKTHPEKDMGKYELTVVQKDTIDPWVDTYKMQILGDVTNAGISMTNKGEGVWSTLLTVKNSHLKSDENGNEATSTTETKYALVYIHNAGGGVEGETVFDFCDLSKTKVNTTYGGVAVTANLLDAGLYSITFNENDGSVTIEKITDKWHVVLDGVVNAEDSGYDLNYDGDTGCWTLKVPLTAQTVVTLKNIDEGATDEDVTVGTLAAGEWAIKYDPVSKEAVYEEADSYYITGDFSGWGNGPKTGDAIKLTKTAEGVYSVTHTFEKNVLFKLVKGNFIDGASDWCNGVTGNGDNISKDAGTYTITFANNTITVVEA